MEAVTEDGITAAAQKDVLALKSALPPFKGGELSRWEVWVGGADTDLGQLGKLSPPSFSMMMYSFKEQEKYLTLTPYN